MLNIVFRFSFGMNILESARMFWSKGAKIGDYMEMLFLLPSLALSLQTHGQSWYCYALARFLMPSDSAFVKKNNLRMSLAGFPSSIVTVEHSCVLDIIVEKFLPPPHSSHLHMFRRQFRVSVKSSAIALDSRIRLNCVHSSKACA